MGEISPSRALKVVARNFRVWRTFWFASLVGNLGQPLLFLLGLGYGLSGRIQPMDGLSYTQFIAPGLAASAVMYSAGFETTYGSYTRLGHQRTFEGMLMTPLTVADIAWGEMVWGALKGCMSGFITVACFPLFGVTPSPAIAGVVPLFFVLGLLFAALGLAMSALAKNYEFFNYFISLFLTPLFLFSGIFFDLATLPDLTGRIFAWLPLTPGVTLSRALCYGHLHAGLAAQGLYLLVFALIAGVVASLLLRRRLIR